MRIAIVLAAAGIGVVLPKTTSLFDELDELGQHVLAPGIVHEHGPIDPFDPLAVEYPDPTLGDRAPMQVWATHYSIPRITEVRSGVRLLDVNDEPLGPIVAAYDFCRAAIGGTVEVTSRRGARRLYTYVGLGGVDEADCTAWYPDATALGRARFRPTRRIAPVLGGTTMVPYRSVAVDPSYIPLGSVLFIPAARGTVVTLDDGISRIHDGYFYAVDTGGNIDGPHIDVYLGFATTNPFIFVKSDPKDTFPAYLIDDLDLEEAFAEAHGTFAVGPQD